MLTISQLIIYPIKSLGAIDLQESNVMARGLAYDRRWLLVDENNHFITQRENTKMALIDVIFAENDGLLVSHRTKNIAPLLVPFTPQTTDTQNVVVWEDEISGIRVSDEADAWFSEVLEKDCRLMYQPDESIRLIDPDYAITGHEHSSFADGYPILLVGQASLDDLNSRLAEKITMNRFRPNIVFSGGEPFQEDKIKAFSVQNAKFAGVKPCARCVLTTINPSTAEKGKEPLATLATYRKSGNKILFGQNVVVHQEGVIRVGDEIVIF